MIVLDTSGLLAALDVAQPQHEEASAALRAAGPPRLLSPFVLAELDYLLSVRVSTDVARRFLDQVARGAYQLEPFANDDVAEAAEVIDKYAGLDLGIADASLVVLARRHDTQDLLTLDQRHFRAVAGPSGKPFRLLPADPPQRMRKADDQQS